MKYKLLIVPGYLIGIGSLFIITYRTILAFFSGSKSITIHINRYGEQYADMAFLIFIWIVCLAGLIYLYIVMKEGKITKIPESNIGGKKVTSKDGLYLNVLRDSLVDEKTGLAHGVFAESSEEIDSRLYHSDDDGNRVVSFNSIKSVKEDVIVEE
jgi:sporulation protein YlmC with PRC-barrel domain